MHRFCKKVIEYMYENKMNQFLSSFGDIYRVYSHMDEDRFFKEWFEREIIRGLIYYFSPSAILSSYEEFRSERVPLFKTYVRIYWRFCRNPDSYPARVRDAMKFFGLEELEEGLLVRKYREMVRKYHPDRAGKSSERMMARINYHYQVLRRYLSERHKAPAEAR